MHRLGVYMQTSNIPKKYASLWNALEFFALNKEGTTRELTAFLHKDYSTASRIIGKLTQIDLIKIERLQKTKVKGKQQQVYRIMLPGLFQYMHTNTENARLKFEKITEAHNDKLLTFKTWPYLKSRGLENLIKDRFFASLQNYLISRTVTFWLFSIQQNKPGFPKMRQDKNTARAADADILGMPFMVRPPDHIKRIIGKKKWVDLMKLFKAIEENYELRTFQTEFLFWLKRDAEERLKALTEWETMLCKQQHPSS